VRTRRVDHLAAATFRFTRGSGLGPATLRLRLALPPTYRGSAAVVTVHRTSGRPDVTPLALSADGDRTEKVGFGRRVEFVEVTLVNASARYRCGVAPNAGYSCDGRSRDDDLRMSVQARALR
jgi:hypothetical protein